jgi:hypothetical protein
VSTDIKWRPYRETDLGVAMTLKQEQDEVLGQPMDFCDLTKHPVLLAEVGMSEGKVIGLHTLEAVPEYCVFSRDPRFTAAAMARAPLVSGMLLEHGFRSIRCFVPEWLGHDTKRITEALQDVQCPVQGEIRHFEPYVGLRHMVLDLRIRS